MVSVVLPVHNGAQYLAGCIDSILGQTYTDFELLVMDDGSTDDSAEVARRVGDSRVKVIECKHDFIRTLNAGIEASEGEYIARMDCDDLMEPERLESQVNVMEQNPDIAVCATHAQTFGLAEHVIGMGKGVIENPMLTFLRGNFVIHPSVMIRKPFLLQHGIRYRDYPYAEDYKMWADICSVGGAIYVMDKPLLKYRISESQVTHKFQDRQVETATRIRQEILETLLAHNTHKPQVLNTLYRDMAEANSHELLDADTIFITFHNILTTIAGIAVDA